MQYIENKTFDEIQLGDHAELTRTLRHEDIELFAVMSGDVNPAHVDTEYATEDIFQKVIAHGMWGGALISAVLGTQLPGPGTIYLNQSLSFRRPVGLGDTVTVRVTVVAKDNEKKRLTLDCLCLNADQEKVIVGVAEVIAPTKKVRRARVILPEVHLHDKGARHRQLIKAASACEPMRTAIVHPCDELSLSGALAAHDAGLIVPVLVGPIKRIQQIADECELDIASFELLDTAHSHASAQAGVKLAKSGNVNALMKGAIHTDEFMEAVVQSATGLRTERRMSHVFGLDVPHYPKPLFITDAAINIEPDLTAKRDIVQNAIDLLHALSIDRPKIAILSATETVSTDIKASIEAAALCKMAQRGQITGGEIDGPLAFDNAVSLEAARVKGIDSQVAGKADVLVAPDLISANMLAKQLIHLAGADAAGLVLGASVPIILTSRSDDIPMRVASSALALLLNDHVSRNLTQSAA